MQAVIEIVTGPHGGRKIRLDGAGAVRVGRAEQADLATQDSFMSGVHFSVECDGQSCLVRDLNSRNGTLLNGKRIGTETLRDRDSISAGETTFIVRLIEGSPEAGTEPARRAQQNPPQISRTRDS